MEQSSPVQDKSLYVVEVDNALSWLLCQGTGEMALLIKYLLGKTEDLSVIPHTHLKSQRWWLMLTVSGCRAGDR